MKKMTLLSAIFGAGIIAYSCGGGGGSSGTVATYITDSPENFKKLEVGIREVSLVNTGTGEECIVFSSDPAYRIDLIEVRNVLQLLDISSCPAGPYNRLRIVMDKSPVEVIDNNDDNGNSYICELVDHDPNHNIPNEVHCDPNTNTCHVLVNGAVNILASQNNHLILDFELKDSEVNLSSNPCTVTFKVTPLHAKGDKHDELSGVITDLRNGSFDLNVHHGMTFTVDYSQVNQTGVDDLLQFAYSKNLKVEVECISLDLNTAHCIAKEIEVEVKGKAQNVGLNSLQIQMDPDDPGSTIDVELEPEGELEGDITNGTEVEAELVGYDAGTDTYIASEVEAD